MSNLLNQISLIFQRITWLSVLDLALVTLIFFGIFMLVRGTQAMVILRGFLMLIVFLSVLVNLVPLPAFSWLIRTTLPSLVVVIPVIFAPELRRALERLGRASTEPSTILQLPSTNGQSSLQQTVHAVVSACGRLSARQHGGLIVLQRNDNLVDYIQTGVPLHASVTPELLLQIFYPNTPLHDGAVIIRDDEVVAAACVMPLSASGILTRSPERHQMGLRHRAALGISEASDAVAVVVSEETGSISIASAGRMIRRLDPERLENILMAFFKTSQAPVNFSKIFGRLFPKLKRTPPEEE